VLVREAALRVELALSEAVEVGLTVATRELEAALRVAVRLLVLLAEPEGLLEAAEDAVPELLLPELLEPVL
jgi:hypothetical protein